MAKVTLVRKKQFAGSAAKMKVFINGELKGVLSPGTQTEFNHHEKIHNITLQNTMSVTNIMANIEDEDIITLEFSAMTGKVKVISLNNCVYSSKTKMSSYQLVFQIFIFVIFFILAFLAFS